MKICIKCKNTKPISEFSRHGRSPDGHQYTCKECFNDYSRENYLKNRERRMETHRKWKENNPDRYRALIKKWRLENPEKVREIEKRRSKKRYNDPKMRLRASISARINESLKKGMKANNSWPGLVGFTLDQLRAHLEKLFRPGMSWENYGTVWEIDHKIPVAVFNFERPNDIDFRLCWSLKNLQPMESIKNKSKGSRVDKPFQPSLALEATG
jgi:hypothetical protein